MFPFTAVTGIGAQVGIFVAFELLFLAVWLSSINRAFKNRNNVIGNLALGTFAAAMIFSVVWAARLGSSFFAFGLLLLIVIVGFSLVKGISKVFEILELGEEGINPTQSCGEA